jgi:hypothetical protein
MVGGQHRNDGDGRQVSRGDDLGPVLATARTKPRKLRAKVQVGKPLAQPIHPSRGVSLTLPAAGP